MEELPGLDVRVAFCLEMSAMCGFRVKGERTVMIVPFPAGDVDQYLFVANVRNVACRVSTWGKVRGEWHTSFSITRIHWTSCS